MTLKFVRSISSGRRWRWHLGLFVLQSVLVSAAEPPVMRDAATHDGLVQRLRQAERVDPMKGMPPTQGPDPAKNLPKDLISQSDIICFGGVATLVPKRAIIMIPKAMANRTQLESKYRLVGWAEFYALNRGWITTVEVTRVQAEGNLPLAEDTTASLQESTKLVVATFQGGPISILPLKEPPPADPAANPAANPATPPPKKP